MTLNTTVEPDYLNEHSISPNWALRPVFFYLDHASLKYKAISINSIRGYKYFNATYAWTTGTQKEINIRDKIIIFTGGNFLVNYIIL